jgi:hypothetical protein
VHKAFGYVAVVDALGTFITRSQPLRLLSQPAAVAAVIELAVSAVSA